MICPGSHSSEVVEPGLEPGSGDRIQLDFLEIQLTCHVILVSGVQQNDAVCVLHSHHVSPVHRHTRLRFSLVTRLLTPQQQRHVHGAASPAVVTVLHGTASRFTSFITRTLYLLSICTHFACPSPPATTSLLSSSILVVVSFQIPVRLYGICLPLTHVT